MALNPFKARRERDERERLEAEEFRWIRNLLRDDLNDLADRLEALEPELADSDPSPDRRAAVDRYTAARAAVRDVETLAALAPIHAELNESRFHLARYEAVARGQEPPTSSTPCHFNAQHGPATVHTTWTGPDGTTSEVAACAEDARLIADGLAPRVRRTRYADAGPWQDAKEASMTQSDRAHRARHQDDATYDSTREALSRLGRGTVHRP